MESNDIVEKESTGGENVDATPETDNTDVVETTDEKETTDKVETADEELTDTPLDQDTIDADNIEDFNKSHPSYKIGDTDPKESGYVIPSLTYNEALSFAHVQSGQNIEFKTQEEYLISMNNLANSLKIVRDEVHSGFFSRPGIKVGLPVGDGTVIAPKFPKMKNKSGANNMIAAISKAVAVGDHIIIPLYHSGFTIFVKPSTNEVLASLKRKLDALILKHSIQTAGLVYTNRSNIVNAEIMKFLANKTVSTTLKLKENEKLLDYIDEADIAIATTYLSATMFPNGYNGIIGCKNNGKVENNSIVCDFTLKDRISILELIRVDFDSFDAEMTETLNKTTPGSVTKTELASYKNKIRNRASDYSEVTIDLENDNDDVIKFNLEFSSCTEAFESSKRWLEDLVTGLEDTIMEEADDVDEREEQMDDLISLSILGNYSSFIKKITFNDHVSEDPKVIIKILSTLSSNDKVYEKLYSSINKYIDAYTVACVAFNNFICPKCNNKDIENKNEFYWDSYIVVEPITYFLDQLSLRLAYKKQRM